MKHLLTLLFVFVTTFTWSQKKELKQAQKLFKSAKISEAKASSHASHIFDGHTRIAQKVKPPKISWTPEHVLTTLHGCHL